MTTQKKAKATSLLLYLISFYNTNGSSQENVCYVNDSQKEITYELSINSIPFSQYNSIPEITIYVNFYYELCQTGCDIDTGFPDILDTAFLIQKVHNMVSKANYYLNNMPPNQIEGPNGMADHIPKAKWKYEIYTNPENENDTYGGIWFVPKGSSDVGYKGNILNVALSNNRLDEEDCHSGRAIDVSSPRSIYLYNIYGCNEIDWKSRVFNHEVAHILGLEHATYCNNQCSDIDLDPYNECYPLCPEQALCDGINPEEVSCDSLNGQVVRKCEWNWGNNMMQQG